MRENVGAPGPLQGNVTPSETPVRLGLEGFRSETFRVRHGSLDFARDDGKFASWKNLRSPPTSKRIAAGALAFVRFLINTICPIPKRTSSRIRLFAGKWRQKVASHFLPASRLTRKCCPMSAAKKSSSICSKTEL